LRCGLQREKEAPERERMDIARTNGGPGEKGRKRGQSWASIGGRKRTLREELDRNNGNTLSMCMRVGGGDIRKKHKSMHTSLFRTTAKFPTERLWAGKNSAV